MMELRHLRYFVAEVNGHRLSIRLVAVWDSRHAAATTIGRFAARLGRFVRDRYHAPAA